MSTKKIPDPLYVVDGKIVQKKAVQRLALDSIDKIEILKTEDAIKPYGKRGKYGVIIISKKKRAKSLLFN